MNIHLHPPAKQRGQRGVTLVELLVTMGLLSVFLVILLGIFTSSIDVMSSSQGYSAATGDSRLILTRLEYDIRRASATTAPAGLGDTAPSLTLTIGGATYRYSMSNGRLQLSIDGDSNYLTGDEATISGLNFQKLGTGGGKESIRYGFTVTAASQSAHEPETQTYTSTTERRL
ncbi:MAG TPA: prepilin-type N-terminal cleavage/methylation domain-containing protein [Candidatus Saccharimonadales bacterium]|jgi:prepilin-type N-terminal cleavage/methylation domain-containing protein|nr:prepilin-type N-terminal cleavage/methylation domain-containing protein [Candidatus Saccharimonadales bacterium]